MKCKDELPMSLKEKAQLNGIISKAMSEALDIVRNKVNSAEDLPTHVPSGHPEYGRNKKR